MANRSYLYSTQHAPEAGAKTSARKMVGIAEWDYDIPLVFKILLSAHPRTCASSIWRNADEIALMGDYDGGVKNLQGFLSKIQIPAAQALIAEAIAFLQRPENRGKYLVLECGEIFDMEETPLLEQNLALLEQVKDLRVEMDRALQSLVPPPVLTPPPRGFLSRIFRRAREPLPGTERTSACNGLEPVQSLGLGNWSNNLYFDLTSR